MWKQRIRLNRAYQAAEHRALYHAFSTYNRANTQATVSQQDEIWIK